MKNRLPFVLSSIAVAVLAGCATESGITSIPAPAAAAPAPTTYVVAPAGTILVPQANAAPAVVAAPAALRAGFGRIESVQILPAAAAGGTASSPNKRIVMRMDDGTAQHFDTHASVAVGDRIEITSNGTMRHPG
jgi:hypothetical protein